VQGQDGARASAACPQAGNERGEEVRKVIREWSWLRGGIALGLLSAFAFVSYKPLGVSTSYPRTVALLLY